MRKIHYLLKKIETTVNLTYLTYLRNEEKLMYNFYYSKISHQLARTTRDKHLSSHARFVKKHANTSAIFDRDPFFLEKTFYWRVSSSHLILFGLDCIFFLKRHQNDANDFIWLYFNRFWPSIRAFSCGCCERPFSCCYYDIKVCN